MPVKVRALEGEPIVVATFTGTLTLDDFREWAMQLARTASSIDSYYIHHLMDMRRSSMKYEQVLGQFQQDGENVLCTDALEGKQLQGLMVAKSPIAQAAASQTQPGAEQLPLFHSPEEAINFARMELARHND